MKRKTRGRGGLQRAGMTLESALNFAHSTYFNRGQGWVEHNGIAGVWHTDPKSKRGKVFRPISRQSAPDYYGSIDGRFIAFDAKSHGSDDPWILPRERIHQYYRLRDIAGAGRAIAWFAIEHRPSRILMLLRIFPTNLEFPRDIPWLEFPPPPGVLQVSDVGGWYDWLPIVRKNWIGH